MEGRARLSRAALSAAFARTGRRGRAPGAAPHSHLPSAGKEPPRDLQELRACGSALFLRELQQEVAIWAGAIESSNPR